MKLSELTHGQVLKYRLGRCGRDAAEWGDWMTGPFFVQRRAKTLKRGREVYPAGEIITITPQNVNTAEFRERDFSDGYFMTEDYYMEIEGLEK